MTKLSLKAATEKWVHGFNAYPRNMIAKLMHYDPEEWQEVTQSDTTFYEELPAWGTMWQFNDWCDSYWLEEKGGLQVLSDCGFRIFKSDEFGHFFGIDGAGYDFYEEHWIPLYKARGLHWHNEEEHNEK